MIPVGHFPNASIRPSFSVAFSVLLRQKGLTLVASGSAQLSELTGEMTAKRRSDLSFSAGVSFTHTCPSSWTSAARKVDVATAVESCMIVKCSDSTLFFGRRRILHSSSIGRTGRGGEKKKEHAGRRAKRGCSARVAECRFVPRSTKPSDGPHASYATRSPSPHPIFLRPVSPLSSHVPSLGTLCAGRKLAPCSEFF